MYEALITLDGWTFLAQICNLMIQLFIFKKLLFFLFKIHTKTNVCSCIFCTYNSGCRKIHCTLRKLSQRKSI